MKILNASFFVMLDNSCLIIFIIILSSKQLIRYILVKIVPCLRLLRCLQLLIFWKILIPMLNRVPTLIQNSIVACYTAIKGVLEKHPKIIAPPFFKHTQFLTWLPTNFSLVFMMLPTSIWHYQHRSPPGV